MRMVTGVPSGNLPASTSTCHTRAPASLRAFLSRAVLTSRNARPKWIKLPGVMSDAGMAWMASM